MPRSGSSNEEAILARHGFTLGAELGEGTYSKVKHCTWQKGGDQSTSKHIAIKVINKKTAPKDFLEKFLPRELDIVRKVILGIEKVSEKNKFYFRFIIQMLYKRSKS